MTGSIPTGWRVATLGQVCSVITDGTHHTPNYVPIGVPFYSVETVTRDDFKNVKYISLEEHNRLIQRCRPTRGDILMTRIGSLADTRLIDWDVDASIYVSLALLRPSRRIEATYLYAYTKSGRFVRDVEERSLLWAVPKKINMGDIARVPVLVPDSLSEQRAIGGVVGDFEAQAKAIERLIAKKREVKQGLMQELLTGRTRLPGHEDQWIRTTYRDVVEIRRGTALKSGESRGGNVPIIGAGLAAAGFTDRSNRRGPVVTISASGASAGYVGFHPGPIFASDCSTIESSLGNNLKFIYYSLLFRQSAIYRSQTGGAQPHVHAKDIYPMELLLPPSEEQHAIAGILGAADDEIAALERRLESARAIEQGAMQELLTGRIRPFAEVAA